RELQERRNGRRARSSRGGLLKVALLPGESRPQSLAIGIDSVWPMMKLNLGTESDGALKVLCLGSHSDDIEIGCGGTILRLIEKYPGCVFHWVVFSAIEVRKAEAQRGAESFVGSKRLERAVFKEFP